MKKRQRSRAVASNLATKQSLLPSSLFDFDLKAFNLRSTSSPKLKKSTVIEARRTSVLTKPNINAPSPAQKTVTSISDLKDLVSSRSSSIKHQIETSYSDILKESEFSHSRVSRKFKTHAQTCQQVVEEADKEYKKVSDLLTENAETMKTSYAKIIKKVEISATHVCKTSIPEIAQSTEKAILCLRSHYGISK
ncbi:hypothetical protein FRX31_028557 [Thalictrum thalictroides]|uniref:Uncharacterized protein n=1 Tax=Thalictrum thalictroides TaxID=46969 RepID=A0A7J6VAP6_THATH|nr:hypothetical protein FRX31_028557 [Thalictrum thalictroides]